jgi:hypothetical protein
MRISFVIVLTILLSPICTPAQLVVHEWGTFTSLQDETGRAIGGINTDDEPVPDFVHRAANFVQSRDNTGKGVPANDSEVTMRLETPVMYFHLPPGSAEQMVDVNIAFRGGWITEYFPDGQALDPGLNSSNGIGPLSHDTVGTLTWRGIKIGGTSEGPQTDDPIWTSPRAVRCEGVRVGSEAEKFLFYRGVAHLDSPLVVSRSPDDELVVGQNPNAKLRFYPEPSRPLPWLVDVRQDGKLAWRHMEYRIASSLTLGVVSPQFADSEFGTIDSLHKDMSDALVNAGLFRDEAEALLNTWQQSYFRNPGLRLFFLVDPDWTNAVLPLRISGPASITRVMVGRIELVTTEQRELIRQIEGFSPADPRVRLKIACPAYEQLGRFRNALLLDELSQRPNVNLARLLTSYSIRAFSPQ